MSGAKRLQDLYADELKDLWSANDQMTVIVAVMADKAQDVRLSDGLKQSAAGIAKHTHSLKELLASAGAPLNNEHCRGMAGLVTEANRHMTADAPRTGELLDLVMVAQYQRMSHYGLAGFGTASAYASALGRKTDHEILRAIVADIYKADRYATEFAQRAEQAAALGDAARL